MGTMARDVETAVPIQVPKIPPEPPRLPWNLAEQNASMPSMRHTQSTQYHVQATSSRGSPGSFLIVFLVHASRDRFAFIATRRRHHRACIGRPACSIGALAQALVGAFGGSLRRPLQGRVQPPGAECPFAPAFRKRMLAQHHMLSRALAAKPLSRTHSFLFVSDARTAPAS